MAVSWLADDEIGRVLGDRYRLIDLIGAGGSAQVYLADDVQLRRRVAVKVLHAALASDQGFLRRFQAEAQAAAALNHPNVVAIYDWGRDGLPFIVTEYLSGGSLRDMIDRGHTLTPAQALLVGLEAARGLDYAHSRGLVHRDIKPGNLMFGEDRRLRIADFGLARALAAATWTEPAGSVLGTARYVSPEQATGGELDGRSDVFSLGLSLVESVTGVQPFSDTSTTVETLRARLQRDIVIDRGLGALREPLHQATRRNPQDRHTARTLGLELITAARKTNRPAPLPILAEDESPVHLGDGDPTAPSDEAPTQPPLVIDEDGVHGTPRVEVAPLTGAPTIRAARASDSDVGAASLDDPFAQDTDDPSGEYPELRVVEDDSDMEPLNPVRRITVEDPTPTASPEIINAHRELRTKRLQRRRYIAMGATVLLLIAMIAFSFIFQPEDRERLGNRLPAQLENTPTTDVGFTAAVDPVLDQYEGRLFDEVRAELESSGSTWSIQSLERASEDVPAGQIIDQDPEAGESLADDGRLVLVVSAGSASVDVPSDLAGTDIESATAQLAEAGIAIGTTIEEPSDDILAGTVLLVEQAGASIPARDATVDVVVSSGPAPLAIPADMIGEDESTVEAALTELGLVPTFVRIFSDEVDKGIVTGIDPVPGAPVTEGDAVTVSSSKGPRYWEIPSVIGTDVAAAKKALQDAGFIPVTDASGDAVVASMIPPAGDFHRKGTEVVLSTADSAATEAETEPSENDDQ